MPSELIRRIVETLLTRTPTRVNWRFFGVCMFVLLMGSFRGLTAQAELRVVGIATLISLVSLGLRWIEHHIPSQQPIRIENGRSPKPRTATRHDER